MVWLLLESVLFDYSLVCVRHGNHYVPSTVVCVISVLRDTISMFSTGDKSKCTDLAVVTALGYGTAVSNEKVSPLSDVATNHNLQSASIITVNSCFSS